MPLNIKCNFCSFAELRSFPFVFPYVLIAVYGDRPNLAEKIRRLQLMLLTSMMTRHCWHCSYDKQNVSGKVFWYNSCILWTPPIGKYAPRKCIPVPSLLSNFVSSGSMSHVPCALWLRWQLTVMGDWWRCRISALFLLLLLHFCSISAATSTFLLYFCCCFYISALFLLLLLHFFHLEEYSAARKINMLDNLN